MVESPENMSLGTAIDLLYDKRAGRLHLEKDIKRLKSEELALRIYIKQLLDKASLEGGKGQTASASIVHQTEPTAKDWPAIYAFIRENDAFDMLQRRLSSTAVKDRWESGIIVPGVEKFDTWDLSVTKSSR